jgi:ferredoxin-NADP reductase
MKRDIAEQLEGYQDVMQLVKASETLGEDFRSEKGAVAAYLERLHPARLSLRVNHIEEETPSTKTFRMVPAAGVLPPFQAGQYVSLQVEVGGILTNRPFSIASSPSQSGYYDLTVKRVPGGLVSNYLLDTLQEGDHLTSSAPDGCFVYNPLLHGQRLVFIAGGSGITPFMSMIRDGSDRGQDRHITLIYGNRSEDDIIYHEELTALAARLTHFIYVPVIEQPGTGYTGEKGFITGDLIERAAGDLKGAMFYLCGPSGMYDFCLAELQARNISPRRIRREMFGPPVHVSQCPGWPADIGEDQSFAVSIVDGPTISARAGTPLLTTFEQSRSGTTLPVPFRGMQPVPGTRHEGSGLPARRGSLCATRISSRATCTAAFPTP